MMGLIAIIALTGMNVLSLYDLRDTLVDNEEERRIRQLDEINDAILNDIISPLRGFNQIELEPIEPTIQRIGQLPANIEEVLTRSSRSPYFKEIFFTPNQVDPCDEGARIYQYYPEQNKIQLTGEYPEILCDGVGVTRTKTKIQLNDFEYRWNNNLEFDTHRSVNLGLINLSESRVIGYLTFTLDQDYILEEALPPLMKNYFGNSDETGTILWVRDWTKGEIIATSDSSLSYDQQLEVYDQRFSGSGFFDSWEMVLGILQYPVKSAYDETLTKNLVVLGVAVLFLMGALIFMFVTAQRERGLAQRQASFLANVTHELKTPLAVMQAAGENISDGRVTEPKRLQQYGTHIYDESIRLRGMIEKLLDVAKADSGQNLLKPAPHQLKGLLSNYLADNRSFIENKGFTVTLKSTEEDTLCFIDQNSFETIASNLTENAIKYSQEDKQIEYQVSASKEHVYFSVTDHGIGIPKKAQKNIFKKFYRVEESDSRSTKIKGHGLGLSIVKNMVDLNGGDIQVKSSLGKGTTFIVRFPKLDSKEGSKVQHNSTEVQSSSTDNSKESTEYVG